MIHIFIEERFSYNLNYEITVVTMVHIYDTKCTIKILGKKTGRNHPCVTPFTTRYNIENLNLDSRRKKLTLLTSLLMFMTSRVMAMLMPFMQETSSVPATSTPPSEPSRKLVDSQRRERRCCPRLMFSPCTRHARTPRTRVVSMTLLRS